MGENNSTKTNNGRVPAHHTKTPNLAGRHFSVDNIYTAETKPCAKPNCTSSKVYKSKRETSPNSSAHHTLLRNFSQRLRKPYLITRHQSLQRRYLRHQVEQCKNHPVANRNKKLARLQRLNLLYRLKSRPRSSKMKQTRESGQTKEQATMSATLPEEQADAVSVTSSDGQAKSVGSASSVSSSSTNITTPDLSDSETKPDDAGVSATRRSGAGVAGAAPELTATKPATATSAVAEVPAAPAVHPPKASKKSRVAAGSAPAASQSASPVFQTASHCKPQSPTAPNSSKKRKLETEDNDGNPSQTATAQTGAAKKTKLAPNRPKEYFETRVEEILQDPLGFDDLVYDDPRPRKAKQIFNDFRKFRKAQGRPISVGMSGARGSATPSEGEAEPRVVTKKRRRSDSEDLSREVLKRAHEIKVKQDNIKDHHNLKGGKRRMSSSEDSLRVAGYLGNQKDRNDSEGGILVGMVSNELRTGPRGVTCPFGNRRFRR